MTSERQFDALLRSWLEESAPSGQPQGLLESVLTATGHTRPRSAWLVRLRGEPMPETGRPGMNRFALFGLAATAVVVAILIGVGLFLRLSPNVGPSPVPGPTHNETPKAAMFAFIHPLDAPGRGALWVANVDGTGARVLVPDPVGDQDAPAWSPDGSRLVFSWDLKIDHMGYPSGESRLYLTDATGSAPQLVDTGCVAPCVGDTDAAFSSDGTHLVFDRSLLLPPTPETPGPGKGLSTPASVIATIDLLTGRVVELASTTIVDCPMLAGQRLPDVPNCASLQNHRPRWSADGTQIVFAQDVPFDINGPEINGMPAPGPPPALFVVDADGRNLHRISPSAWSGDWSPDGARIAFESMSYVTDPQAGSGAGYGLRQYFDIYTIQPDGTDLRRLTSDQFSFVPSWSADGRIGFVRQPMVDGYRTMGPQQFWIMDADGSHATQFSVVSPQLQEAWPISWPPRP
jgi:dipeptidyl aminopeptidase/acylaminoacyl peptidase